MPDRELDELIRDHLARAVRAHGERLAEMESRVLQKLLRPRKPAMWQHPTGRWGLALAAGAALFLLGFVAGLRSETTVPADGVVFVVAMPEAQQVELVGSFNGWMPTPMVRRKGGLWVTTVKLPPGRYEYAFRIDGTKWWGQDPRADQYVKSYGDNYNSVIYVASGKRT